MGLPMQRATTSSAFSFSNIDNKSIQTELERLKIYKDGFFIKSLFYKEKHTAIALERLNLFDRIQEYEVFPNSCVEVDNKKVTIKQKEISPKKLSNLSLNEAHFISKKFVSRMQQAWGDGFVHGDINRRNIFCDSNGLGLFDFEPYLEVIQSGRFRLKATKPYVCPFDIENKKISKSTDEIGLAVF